MKTQLHLTRSKCPPHALINFPRHFYKLNQLNIFIISSETSWSWALCWPISSCYKIICFKTVDVLWTYTLRGTPQFSWIHLHHIYVRFCINTGIFELIYAGEKILKKLVQQNSRKEGAIMVSSLKGCFTSYYKVAHFITIFNSFFFLDGCWQKLLRT